MMVSSLQRPRKECGEDMSGGALRGESLVILDGVLVFLLRSRPRAVVPTWSLQNRGYTDCVPR